MEKFIKQYGILVLVGVAVYWFFIRKKDEVDEVVVDIGDGESSNWIMKDSIRTFRSGSGGGKINECPCPKGQKCVSAKSGSGNRYCVLKGVVGGGQCSCSDGQRCTCGGWCPDGSTCGGGGSSSRSRRRLSSASRWGRGPTRLYGSGGGGGCGACTAPTECCQSSFPHHCRKCPKGVASGTRITGRAPRAYVMRRPQKGMQRGRRLSRY